MWRELIVEHEAATQVAAVREGLMELSRAAERAARVMPEKIVSAGKRCAVALANGNKILVCGNGGSAADAQHFVAELIGRMGMERAPLAAICLNVDPSVVTCIANDYGYAELFARQVRGLGRPGDVLIGVTTSGRSENVLAALEAGREGGLETIALAGRSNERLDDCDLVIEVDGAGHTARIQEIHTAALHAVCDVIERALFA